MFLGFIGNQNRVGICRKVKKKYKSLHPSKEQFQHVRFNLTCKNVRRSPIISRCPVKNCCLRTVSELNLWTVRRFKTVQISSQRPKHAMNNKYFCFTYRWRAETWRISPHLAGGPPREGVAWFDWQLRPGKVGPAGRAACPAAGGELSAAWAGQPAPWYPRCLPLKQNINCKFFGFLLSGSVKKICCRTSSRKSHLPHSDLCTFVSEEHGEL